MSIQIIEKQGSPWGRLGKGIGQGLSEQVPKEIDRYRLASGLKELGKKSKSGKLTPFEQFTELASIYGISPQMVQSGSELLRNEAVTANGSPGNPYNPNQPMNPYGTYNSTQNNGNQGVPQTDQQNYSPNVGQQGNQGQGGQPQPPTSPKYQPTVEQFAKKSIPGFHFNTPKEYEKKFKSLTDVKDVAQIPMPVMSVPEKEAAAQNLYNKFRNRFPNLQAAKEYVNEYDTQQQNMFLAAKDKRVNDIGNEKAYNESFERDYALGFQKEESGTFQDVPGEYKKIFRDQGLELVKSGKETPEEGGKIMADRALQFAKRRSDLKKLGGSEYGKASDKLVSDVKTLRGDYESIGALPLFIHDMKEYNHMGDHLASTIAKPMSHELYSGLPKKDVPKDENGKPIGKVQGSVGIDKVHIPQKEFDKMVKGIKPTDSMFTLGLMLNDLGYDDVDTMEKIQKLKDENKISLNDDQQKELTNYYGLDYTIGDLFESALWDIFNQTKKLPYPEKIRRQFWGKR